MEYILTAQIKVDEDEIQRAKKWSHRRGYAYKKSEMANMVFDYLTDGGQQMEMQAVVIEKNLPLNPNDLGSIL